MTLHHRLATELVRTALSAVRVFSGDLGHLAIKRRLLTWLAALLFASCNFIEEGSENGGESGGAVDAEAEGSVELSLDVISLAYNSNTAGPTFTVLELNVATSSELSVYVDDMLTLAESIPASCTVLPATTICDDSIDRNIGFIVEDSGAHNFEVTITDGSRFRTLTFTDTIEQGSCQPSESVYVSEMQPYLQANCERCHGDGTAGVFRADDSWAEISDSLVDRGDIFYKAPSGEEGAHTDIFFSQYGEIYRLFAEMVWRAETNFSCS